MGKLKSRNQRGFTLIEMSIVLVIIGLIIGGILKGQELIESARQKNVISQVDALRASVQAFQDRFKSMPGDYGAAVANINAQLKNGNDDGVVSSQAANATPLADAGALAGAAKDASEEFQFFNHLIAANLLGGASLAATTTATTFAGSTTISPLPGAPFPNTGFSVVYGTHEGSAAGKDARTLHWLVVSRFGTNLKQTGAAEGAVSPQRAFQLDTKYDDGLPESGAIRTFGLTADCGVHNGADSYSPLITKQECELVFSLQ